MDLRPAVAMSLVEKRREKKVLRKAVAPENLAFDGSICEEAKNIRGALDLYSGIGGVANSLWLLLGGYLRDHKIFIGGFAAA